MKSTSPSPPPARARAPRPRRAAWACPRVSSARRTGRRCATHPLPPRSVGETPCDIPALPLIYQRPTVSLRVQAVVAGQWKVLALQSPLGDFPSCVMHCEPFLAGERNAPAQAEKHFLHEDRSLLGPGTGSCSTFSCGSSRRRPGLCLGPAVQGERVCFGSPLEPHGQGLIHTQDPVGKAPHKGAMEGALHGQAPLCLYSDSVVVCTLARACTGGARLDSAPMSRPGMTLHCARAGLTDVGANRSPASRRLLSTSPLCLCQQSTAKTRPGEPPSSVCCVR